MSIRTSATLVGYCLLTLAAPCFADDPPAAPSGDAGSLRQQIAALHWIHGPQQMQLFANATFQVPAGYVFLNPEETAKLETLTHNIGGGTEYFFAPEDLHWWAHFSYSDDGYVKDDEKIDAAGLLASIKENTEATNKLRRERGWDEMAVLGWQVPPHYDPQTNRLEWAVIGKDLASNTQIVNFNTKILGRGGVTSALLVADPASLAAATDEFKSTLVGFDYVQGQRYAEYKEGDKIAKYGLAALVTGGAAAIAVKTGLWKVVVSAVVAGWKFIAAAFVALFGGIMRRFKKNNV
jgi:uncharacterized membrane-anchored protein